MHKTINYYTILGIKRNATDDDIKKAYRKMAMKWHPDRNSESINAEDKFKEAKFAYETLSNEYKRKQHDYELESQENKQTKNKDFFKETIDDNFIIQVDINVEFWESIFGCNKTFELTFLRNKVREQKTISVKFPAGTQENESFIVESDDIQIKTTIKIKPDEFFTRNNLDLFTHIDVSFILAALGGKIIFPHWSGNLEVIVPPGIKPNQTLLCSNKGIVRDIFVGDLYLICNISVPKKLTKKQKELLEAFRETEEMPNNLFDRIKKTWSEKYRPR
ncbi:J domain-containing protein [archaeon]|nr:J domain-containing protein [archaeon]